MDATLRRNTAVTRLAPFETVGLLVGVVMPVIAAALYPVYMHQMQPAWAEWTRLLELPFVACELVVTHIAIRRGYSDAEGWARLPKDIRWALGVLAVGLVASSALVSKNPAVSIAISLITVVHLRFGAAVFHLARSEPAEVVAPLFRWLSWGLVALTLLTAVKFAFPPPPETVPGGRVVLPAALPGFINVRHFGSWTGAIAAGLMVRLLYGRADRATVLFYLLAAGLTCWSGTRAAVVAMAVAGLVAAAMLRRLPSGRGVALVAATSIVGLIAGILLAPAGWPEFSLIARETGDMNAITSGRVELWLATFRRWLDAPLFGWGSGSVFWEVDIGWAHTQPHNAVLQFLISWGLVGAGGALWVLARAIGATVPAGLRDETLRPLAATLIALLFMSLLEGMLHYPRFIAMIAIGFAVILARKPAPDR